MKSRILTAFAPRERVCGKTKGVCRKLNGDKDTMFEGIFQPMHLIIVLGIVLLVFGPKKLPELGKGLGEAIRGFKKGFNEEAENPTKSETTTQPESSEKSYAKNDQPLIK